MIKVTEYIFRGPHLDPGFLDIRGIVATLDLETGMRFIGDGSPLEEALIAAEHNIRVWAHPLGAIFPPTTKELKDALNLLFRERRGGVYVHCAKGVDRTGMVIAAYRILEQGWSPREAAKEAIAQGMHFIYWWWLIQLWRLE